MNKINLNELFDIQRKLDDRIVKQKQLGGHDLIPEKILALRTELGELSNEIPSFKFWSDNKMPKAYKDAKKYAEVYDSKVKYPKKDAAMEEYVDGLHFILSIGIELGTYSETEFQVLYADMSDDKPFNVTAQLNAIFDAITDAPYEKLVGYYLGFGLQFASMDEIKAHYLAKNEENHNRQTTGY